MSQNNKKIIRALKEWNEPIEGWFWDSYKEHANKGNLFIYSLHKNRPVYSNGFMGFKNFSLTNPNERKLISTAEEAQEWATANPNILVKLFSNIDKSIEWNYSLPLRELSDHLVQTSLTEWTPITEIEVV